MTSTSTIYQLILDQYQDTSTFTASTDRDAPVVDMHSEMQQILQGKSYLDQLNLNPRPQVIANILAHSMKQKNHKETIL